jgi:hypothetical protein
MEVQKVEWSAATFSIIAAVFGNASDASGTCRNVSRLIRVESMRSLGQRVLTADSWQAFKAKLGRYQHEDVASDWLANFVEGEAVYEQRTGDNARAEFERRVKTYSSLCSLLKCEYYADKTFAETISPDEMIRLLDSVNVGREMPARTGQDKWVAVLEDAEIGAMLRAAYRSGDPECNTHEKAVAYAVRRATVPRPKINVSVGGTTVSVTDVSTHQDATTLQRRRAAWLGEICAKPADYHEAYDAVCDILFHAERGVLGFAFIRELIDQNSDYVVRPLSKLLFHADNEAGDALVEIMLRAQRFANAVEISKARKESASVYSEDGSARVLCECANTYFEHGSNIDELLRALERYSATLAANIGKRDAAGGAANQYGFDKLNDVCLHNAQELAAALAWGAHQWQELRTATTVNLEVLGRQIQGRTDVDVRPSHKRPLREW